MILLLRLNILLILLFLYTPTIAYEALPFNIIHQTDVYEIRYYNDRLAVQATYSNQDSSFRKLFNYISGENIDSKKIKMTIPVTQLKNPSGIVMQFYLPLKFTKKNVPVPTNPKVKVINIEGGYYAAIKYSGRLTDKNFDKYKKILKKNLIENKIEIIGPAIKAIYNGPFTLPFFRHNEAMFRVNWKNF